MSTHLWDVEARLPRAELTGPLIDSRSPQTRAADGRGGMLAGLVVFQFAHSVASLLLVRALHGAAIGITVVAVGVARLGFRPSDWPRTGWLSGIVVSLGWPSG